PSSRSGWRVSRPSGPNSKRGWRGSKRRQRANGCAESWKHCGARGLRSSATGLCRRQTRSGGTRWRRRDCWESLPSRLVRSCGGITMDRPHPPKGYNGYPTAGGKPMGETDWHRDVLGNLTDSLERFYQDEPLVYVSGWLWVYYVPGNRRRRVAP